MQGNFVEVGVNTCGAYGSSINPTAPGPIGVYHPTELGLGFVADSDQDGWGTGSPPYCGDYFVPGSPVEGWGITVGSSPGNVRINTDQGCSPFQIPGSISSYSDDGLSRTVIWEGTYNAPAGTMSVNQTTITPADRVYFLTRVILCNNGLAPLIDVYYGRNVDPDNDQPWSTDFVTTNTIVRQPPIDDEALVTAVGLTFGCFLGLGARDPNARVSRGNFFTGSPYQVWNGLGGYMTSGTGTTDDAVSIAFRIDTLDVNECACLAYAYILNEDDLSDALDATATAVVFADTTDITLSGEARYCVGDSTNLTVIGGGGYDWSWTPSVGLNTDIGPSVWASPDTPTLYTLTGTNGFCGDIVRTIVVIPEPAGVADAGRDLTICLGDTIALEGVAGIGPSRWVPVFNISDPNQVNPLVWPDVTTEYIIRTESDFGCPGFDSMMVFVNPLPEVSAGEDVAVCIGDEVQLIGSGAVNYLWDPADFLDNEEVFNPFCEPLVTTTYVLTGTDINGCSDTDTITVTVNPLPDVNAGEDQTIDLVKGEEAELNATSPGGIIWSWNPPDGLTDPNIPNPFAQPQETTVYILTVEDANGCINSDTLEIEVLNNFQIIIPDAFTPNGDGLNDLFHAVIIGLIQVQDITIYNRWGEQVFYATERGAGWDGTYRGVPQEMGTYIVVVRILDAKGNPVKQAGTTTLIR